MSPKYFLGSVLVGSSVTLLGLSLFAKPEPPMLSPLGTVGTVPEVLSASTAATPEVTLTPAPTPTPTPRPKPTPPPLTPTPSPSAALGEGGSPTPSVIYTKEMLDSYFDKYSALYAVDIWQLRRIAVCESGYRYLAVNGPYVGMFQFAKSTWIATRQRMGLDPNPDLRLNPEEAVKTAAFKIHSDGPGAWPKCQ